MNFKTKYLLFCFGLICFKSSQTGLSDIWKSTKNSVNKVTSNLTNQTSKIYNNIRKQAQNLITSNSNTANITNSYSFNPRDLISQSSSKYFGSYIPTLPLAQVISKTISTASLVSNKLLHQLDSVLIPKLNKTNPFRNTPATLRIGIDLPAEEYIIMQNRKKHTQPALENFLEMNLAENQTLNIGFCGSGGGYRAMLSTVGFLNGAQKIGLLDTVGYMSALSGSTWALGPWTSLNLPIDKFRSQLIPKTRNMFKMAGKYILPTPTGDQINKMFNNFELKYLFHQSITSVDLWGAMIANKLFEDLDQRQNLYMSNQAAIIEDAKHIFPIYTAVHPLQNLNYNWFEFTPYEAGSVDLQAFTPIWAFGRKFLNGVSIASPTISEAQFAPEQTLGFYLGIFGSAFTVNLNEILEMMRLDESVDSQNYDDKRIKVEILQKLTHSLAGIKDLKNTRISPAKIMNFTYGLKDSPIKDLKKITLVDAGLAFNLPIPPLLRPQRAIDVIFIFDASDDSGTAGELKKAEKYARSHNLPFPMIDYSQAQTQTISIFKDDQDPKIPTIIYLPLIKDLNLPSVSQDSRFADFDPKECIAKDYCSTFNFKYEPEEFETLTLLTEYNLADNHNLIKETFKQILINKYKTN
jgi:phospholipase A2